LPLSLPVFRCRVLAAVVDDLLCPTEGCFKLGPVHSMRHQRSIQQLLSRRLQRSTRQRHAVSATTPAIIPNSVSCYDLSQIASSIFDYDPISFPQQKFVLRHQRASRAAISCTMPAKIASSDFLRRPRLKIPSSNFYHHPGSYPQQKLLPRPQHKSRAAIPTATPAMIPSINS